MKAYDAFFSYSSENEQVASEIVGALKSRGFNIWYAPLNIPFGSGVYDSIEAGLANSNAGILLISKSYLARNWTKYEMDVLLKQRIESKKDIFPIWHEIEKRDIETLYPGLANIQAANTSNTMRALVDGLASALAKFAPTIGKVPSYECPVWRFKQGRGEIFIRGEDGPATTIWEFLLCSKDEEYPLFVEGNSYTKDDMLFEVAQWLPHIFGEFRERIGEERISRLWAICAENGFNPHMYA